MGVEFDVAIMSFPHIEDTVPLALGFPGLCQSQGLRGASGGHLGPRPTSALGAGEAASVSGAQRTAGLAWVRFYCYLSCLGFTEPLKS